MKRDAFLSAMLLALAFGSVLLAQPPSADKASVDDKVIAQSILDKLEAAKDSGQLRDFGIDLKVDEGVVRLKGRVPSQQALDLILHTARRASGVNLVVNELVIRTARAELAADDLKPTAFLSTPRIQFFIASNEPSSDLVEARIGDTNNKIYLHEAIQVAAAGISVAGVKLDTDGQHAIQITFIRAGKANMAEMTAKHIGKLLAVVVDGQVIAAPTIREKIDGKATIPVDLTKEAIERIVTRLTLPTAFEASMLLIKADWSQVGAIAKAAMKADLREALQDATVPQALLDRLPESGPEVLFPREIVSVYTPPHYAELLAWLAAKDLIVDRIPFPEADLVPTHIAASETSIYRDASNPFFATSLQRSPDFFGTSIRRSGPQEAVPPFVTQTALFDWHVAESSRSFRDRLIFQRRAYMQETKRGQPPQTSDDFDECLFDGAIPHNHVAIVNAFPDDLEETFRAGALEKGFVPLIVVAPLLGEKNASAAKARVRAPDVVETMKTRYAHNPHLYNPLSYLMTAQPDIEQPPLEVRTYTLKSTDANAVSSTFKQLFRDDISIAADSNNNSLVVRAPAALHKQLHELFIQLDEPPLSDTELPAVKGDDKPTVNAQALREAYAASELAARETAAMLRDAPPQAAASKLAQQLRSQVLNSFQTRQALHEAELAGMEAQLRQSRETIAMRNRIKEEIIDRRVADLLNPALRWESDNGASHATELPDSNTSRAASKPRDIQGSIPSHLESLLQPLWPLLRERQQLLGRITELEFAVVELQQPEKIPGNAKPEEKQRLEARRKSSGERTRAIRQEIDELRSGVDSIDQKIALLKESISIKGAIVSVKDESSVEISIGHDDGVQSGMKFQVFDNDSDIGAVEVVKVEADSATARVTLSSKEKPIRRGHRIATFIDDRAMSDLIGHDRGEPIYNDRLKRFKFQLEKIDVTNEYEVAEMFWRCYQGQGKPKITAVWGDPRTNSLVIVGPPEADQAIRDTLAVWQGMQIGIEVDEDVTLEDQLKRFERYRRSALAQVARRKLEIIDAESAVEPDEERIQTLNLDLEGDMAELEKVERKLKVITESMERLNGDESQSSDEAMPDTGDDNKTHDVKAL